MSSTTPLAGAEPATGWVRELSGLSDFSTGERAAVEKLLVDALGIAGAGRDAPSVGAAVGAWERDFGTGPVRLPWLRGALPAPVAAAAQSALIHAWDFDDTHDTAVVHTACVAVPAALAAALAFGRSGADALAGVVVGVQVLARVSSAVGPRRGMIRTAALGALGASAAAARTLGLAEPELTAALGLALPATGSSVTRQVVAEGAATKRLQPAFAVQAGVSAALLAASGVPGPGGWLTGEYGVLAVRGDDDQADALAAITAPGLEVTRLSLKPYPVCRYAHAAIAAALSVSPTTGDQVESVTVRVPASAGYQMVARPFRWRGQPVADVQFSIPWLVAAALRTGTVDLGTLRDPVLSDPEIERLAGRVRVRQDLPEQDGMAPAELELRRFDGHLERRHAPMPGSPTDPLTLDDVLAKAGACLRAGGHPDSAPHRVRQFAADLADLDAADLRDATVRFEPQES